MAARRKPTGSGRDPSRKRNSTSTTGVFRSIRDGSEHVFESGHEMANLIAMDVDPSILSFEVQPETFDLGGRRSYTADVRAETADGVLYKEVKPERILARDPTLRGRIDAIRDKTAAGDAGFEVVAEEYYRHPDRRYNANLLRHSTKRRLPAAAEKASAVLRASPSGATLLEIVRGMGMGIEGRFAVLRMVALGQLIADGNGEIGPETIVRPRSDQA